MNKENNRSAAGLRRSAIAERLRLREEWSALKGTTDVNLQNKPQKRDILKETLTKKSNRTSQRIINKINIDNHQPTTDVLRGIVALVEVGVETRALPLRAALAALGATVVPNWSPLVTHVVWTQGGCRATRAKARALACRLVSPLWVEACAASSRRLPEQTFPAAARPSDLPSPRTLKTLLKKAEMENISIADLLSDSKDDSDQKPMRLRISSETERDTSTDTSVNTSRDTSANTSKDSTIAPESRVNTAKRRPAPITPSPTRPAKSRRKLFTHKEAEIFSSNEETPSQKSSKAKKAPTALSERERRELARAERLARRLVALTQRTDGGPQKHPHHLVLTGMSRLERKKMTDAIRSLGGRIKSEVNRKTTHVLLGSCRGDFNITNFTEYNNITGVNQLDTPRNLKPRTLNALLGAARGCKVLFGQWALDSAQAKSWMHHHCYEVPHLKKISQKARVERAALGKLRSEYGYDVFNGMRVNVTQNAEQRDGVLQLLSLCGAVTQNGGRSQNGCQDGGLQDGVDISVGVNEGEISSKWVFDSVAAGSMRTTRRYVNSLSGDVLPQTVNR